MLKTLTIVTLFLSSQGCHYLPGLTQSMTHQCLVHCQQELQICKKRCLGDCHHCCQYTKSQAQNFYQRYLVRTRIEGKPAFSSLHSFYDPLQCNKNSCNCQIDLGLCKQNCQGKIQKRLKTYKYC